MQKTYEITPWAYEWLEKQLKKLNRRAGKLGTAEITAKKVREFNKVIEIPCARTTENPRGVREAHILHYEVLVEGETPMLEGWWFAATVEAKEIGNVIRKSPYAEDIEIPERFRTTDPKMCEHCGTKRLRKDTYIVHHWHRDEWKQVGSGCLKDFVGHKNPLKLAQWVEDVQDFLAEMLEPRFPGETARIRYNERYPTHWALTLACAAVRMDGWISRKQSIEWDKSSTADVMRSLMAAYLWPSTDRRGREAEKELLERYCSDDELWKKDHERAGVILNWMKSLDPKDQNEYMSNLAILGHEEAVEWRDLSLLASANSAYWWAVEKPLQDAEEKKHEPVSEHVGEIGERLDFVGTVDFVHTYNSNYRYAYNDHGERMVIKVKDDAGNLFVWFTGHRSLEKGEKIAIRGTVKDHSEYKGVKQTNLTRCTIKDIETGEKIY